MYKNNFFRFYGIKRNFEKNLTIYVNTSRDEMGQGGGAAIHNGICQGKYKLFMFQDPKHILK